MVLFRFTSGAFIAAKEASVVFTISLNGRINGCGAIKPRFSVKLKDMEKSVNRTIAAINNDESIGIIADYDVDGSTSASILFKFLNHFSNKIYITTPNRLSEGYGPNIRIMNEMLESKVDFLSFKDDKPEES